MRRRLRECWEARRGAVNGWLSVPSPVLAEATGEHGFDSVTIDMQHGLIDYQCALAMLQSLRASSATPMVRVPWLEPGIIMKSLDAGALGVICPMVNSRREAEELVSFAHYAPRGVRSFGPTRAGLAHGRDYFVQANDSVVVLAMIETETALDAIEAIVSTPDLTGVYIGPSDLSLSLGYEPRLDHDEPDVVAAIEHILAVAHDAGIRAGVHCAGAEYARRMLSLGFDLVTLGSDLRLYRGALDRALNACRH